MEKTETEILKMVVHKRFHNETDQHETYIQKLYKKKTKSEISRFFTNPVTTLIYIYIYMYMYIYVYMYIHIYVYMYDGLYVVAV